MKYTLLIILFLLYSFFIFIINNPYLLLISFITNMLLLIITKAKLKKYFSFILKSLMLILVIFICNIIFSNTFDALLISSKLLLALSATYLITENLTSNNFTEGFYYLLYPLKIFRADIKMLSLTITVALAFIPILADEAKNIKLALLSKGFKFNLKNVITKPHIFLITYINGLFKRVDEIELALKIKGFN